MADWRPSATAATVYHRAALLTQIRQFFAKRGVIEVDTPIFSNFGNTDPNINSFIVYPSHHLNNSSLNNPQDHHLYCHTSPEFAMKRLLAAGYGAIYQICKVFRHGELGRFHNPEFTLLEWYRPNFDHHDLMDEMDELLIELLNCQSAIRLSYQDIFLTHCGINPHTATIDELAHTAIILGISPINHLTRDGWLDLILTHCIADKLDQNNRPTFIYDYPASQAALAKIRSANPQVAERFEVYWQGIELANGFHELSDPLEQRHRFLSDCNRRHELGLPLIPIDEHLLAALNHGLPPCAGVALGIERLLMIKLGITHINEVIAFPYDRA